MTRSCFVIGLGLLALTALAHAEDNVAPTRSFARPSHAIAPFPVPSLDKSFSQASEELNVDQFDGMFKALQFLQSTKHVEAATDLRHKLTELQLKHVSRLLAEKTKALEELQAELDALRPSKNATQVTLSFKILELSRTKLQESGFDFYDKELLELITKQKGFEGFEVFAKKSEGVADLLNALQERNLAKVLAEPMLATVCGRKTRFHSGGELTIPKVPGENAFPSSVREYGTSIEVLPALLEDGRLKFDFQLRLAEPDPKLNAVVAGQTLPGFRTRQVSTGVVLRPGESVLLRGLTQNRTETSQTKEGTQKEVLNEIELLVIVRAEIVASER